MEIPGKEVPFPTWITPMQPVRAAKPPKHYEGWIYEEKKDGFRCLVYLDNGRVRLQSKDENFYELRDYASIVDELSPLGRYIFDGELVILDASGVPRLELMQKKDRRL